MGKTYQIAKGYNQPDCHAMGIDIRIIYIYTQYYICIYDSYVLQNPSDSESLRHPLRLGDPKCLVCFG